MDTLPVQAQWVLFGTQMAAALAIPILLWYAYETRRLRQSAEIQNQMSIQPLLATQNWLAGTVNGW